MFAKRLFAIALNVTRITNYGLQACWCNVLRPWAHINRPQLRNHNVMQINRITCNDACFIEYYAYLPDTYWY